MICIIGPTGCGKTKLSLDLSIRLNAEVISADSKQVYKGLDIGSAKATKEEQDKVVHHLLSHVPIYENYSASMWAKDANKCVEVIKEKNKIPIVCGGTMYYVESLLFDSAVVIGDKEIEKRKVMEEKEEKIIKRETNQSRYEYLCSIDPDMGRKLHQNDTRKIERAIQSIHLKSIILKYHSVYESTGIPWSSHLLVPSVMKYSVLFLCVFAEYDVLDKRIDDRVEQMIKLGLIQEIVDLHYELLCYDNYRAILVESNSDSKSDDEDVHIHSGIAESIGYQEFLPLVRLLPNIKPESKHFSDTCSSNSSEILHFYAEYFSLLCKQDCTSILHSCIQQIKFNSKRYARRQMRWIKNRLSRLPNFFMLDTSGTCFIPHYYNFRY